MPQTKNDEFLKLQEKYIEKRMRIVTNNNVVLDGNFKALEYDKSIILQNVDQFIKFDDQAVEQPTLQSKCGWILCQRKNMLIPGKLIQKVFLFNSQE